MLTCIIILHSPNWPIRSCHVTIFQNETLTLIFTMTTLHGSCRRLRPPQFHHLPSRRWSFAPAPFTNLHHLHHLHRAVHHGSAPVGVAKRAGPNGPARQPVLKGMGWVEDFNPSARSSPSRPARQLDGPKYGPTRPAPLARFKKIK